MSKESTEKTNFPLKKTKNCMVGTDNELSGWNEFSTRDIYIRSFRNTTNFKRELDKYDKKSRKNLHPLKSRGKNDFASFALMNPTESDKLDQENSLSRTKKKYLNERYTFIKRKSISQLANLFEALEPDVIKPNDCSNKFVLSKKSKALPEKPEKPIFGALPQIEIHKLGLRKLKVI